MKQVTIIFLFITTLICADWGQIKDNTMPFVALPEEYSTPYKQPLSVLGWEDGIQISRDGLNLYCIYIPVDWLSWKFAGLPPDTFSLYRRGPDLGMDLVTNPNGSSEWLHGDILYSNRNSVLDSFSTWELSGISSPVWTEGALNPLYLNDRFMNTYYFTSNNNPPNYSVDIWSVSNSSINPFGPGLPLSASINSDYNEDNPHLEQLSASQRVLLFDSDDRPGVGNNDIWWSISEDNGVSWTLPENLTSINTNHRELQPHLYKDGTEQWYLYYTGTMVDGSLGIFRARQSIPDDWNSWVEKVLVIGIGNAAGVGEPTVTSNGDISFVVIYEDTNGTSTDRYDADAWFLPKNETIQIEKKSILPDIFDLVDITPNPFDFAIDINITGPDYPIKMEIFNLRGKKIKEFNNIRNRSITWNAKDMAVGLYMVSVTFEGRRIDKKVFLFK